MTDLTNLTIREVGELMRRRDISATELVDSTLARIGATEPRVHAFAAVLNDGARRNALEVDREFAKGIWRGPLHGVPLGVKDLCYMKDTVTRAGSAVLADFTPMYDATVVRKLREAGAIIVGKTTTHEFALGQNRVQTRNPWHEAYYPGGSSAGSGVAVAVRSVFGSIGTDTAGSVRAPASINGIVGLKPTYGRVSTYGVIPASRSLDHVGPMARTVEDCALLLQAIAGRDAMDSASASRPVDDYCQDLGRGIAGMRLGVDRAYFLSERVDSRVRAAVDTALQQLEAQGADVLEVEVPELEVMTAAGLTILLVEASAVHRRLLHRYSAKYDRDTRLMLQIGQLVPGAHYVSAQQARTLLRTAVKHVFHASRLDALIAPTLPVPTVELAALSVSLARSGEQSSLSGFVRHCIPANVTGQPALTLPCGFTSDGLPIGLQLIGRPFQEGALLRIADAYEAAHSWCMRQPPDAQAQVQPPTGHGDC